MMQKSGKIKKRVIIREKKKEGGGPPALRVMAPDRNTWVREKGPSLREEGIVYSDYMGSGLGNKPSHGGNGYKIGSMVATVLSRLGLGLEARRDQESCAYARAEQKQSDFEKAKGSVDEGRPVYESKKRVAARGHTMVRGEKGWWKMEGARGRTKPRWRETGRKEEGDMTRKTKKREPQHREPSYWNLNNNYSV